MWTVIGIIALLQIIIITAVLIHFIKKWHSTSQQRRDPWDPEREK